MIEISNECQDINAGHQQKMAAKTVLDKAKQARKGKRYVILATIERPTVFYEVEESKFNARSKRYAAFRVVERGIWK